MKYLDRYTLAELEYEHKDNRSEVTQISQEQWKNVMMRTELEVEMSACSYNYLWFICKLY
jgi:hypothetical protein